MPSPRLELVPIDRSGRVARSIAPLPELCRLSCTATARFYDKAGFEPPWIGYLAVDQGRAVGGGAFKSAPRGGKVEIAYYTAPELEGRGYATSVARELVKMAQREAAGVQITAQTLPQENASTAILRKLGFVRAGSAQDDEAGEVWEWELPQRAARGASSALRS